MNNLRLSCNVFLRKSIFKRDFICLPFVNTIQKFSEDSDTPRISLEKSVNHVTLIGRVGQTPQLRGTETKPVVVFTLATNTNYKYDTGDIQQKTDWHRISVFKPYLRNTVLDYLKKGSRVYIEGRILYGEFNDSNGVSHSTTTIVAKEVIFIGAGKKRYEETDETIEKEENLA